MPTRQNTTQPAVLFKAVLGGATFASSTLNKKAQVHQAVLYVGCSTVTDDAVLIQDMEERPLCCGETGDQLRQATWIGVIPLLSRSQMMDRFLRAA